MAALIFIEKVMSRDFTGAIVAFKNNAFKKIDAKIPTWNRKMQRVH